MRDFLIKIGGEQMSKISEDDLWGFAFIVTIATMLPALIGILDGVFRHESYFTAFYLAVKLGMTGFILSSIFLTVGFFVFKLTLILIQAFINKWGTG